MRGALRVCPYASPRCAAVVAFVAASIALAGCSTSRFGVPAGKALGADIDDMDPASLAEAAERTEAALERATRSVTIGGRKYSSRELAASARRVAAIARSESDPARLSKRLARECRAYPAGEKAKVTGYFEPVLDARRRPDKRFRYPVYAPPSVPQLEKLRRELGRIPTRADIDSGNALGGLGLELAWLDDPVARFFLHVQGSGRLVFEDGSQTRIGFAGSNDLAYRSVGTVMLGQGLLERGKASATAMRKWLSAHPERRDALLFTNPRYIYFRDNGRDGPIGALGATLVAGRSIATDDRFVPRGVLAWLRTTRPVVDADGTLVAKQPLTRFVFAQDAGAAIEGAARVDLFVGSGEAAGLEAGGMNEAGELYVLMCRGSSPPGPPVPPRPMYRQMPRP
ncbi:MAG: MltA domain-containing protein [Candidatus Binatia bacterium]